MTAVSESAVTEPIDPANSVLGKLTLLLDSFGFDAPELSLSELVRCSGLAKPTVHRLCGELLQWGYLERVGIRYRLGIRLFEIGQRVVNQCSLRDVARPFMVDLQQATRGAVHLAVRDGLDVLYIDKVNGPRTAQPTRIAGRMPMHCTASGKVLLAFAGPVALRQIVTAGLTRITPYTITAPAHLARDLARVRTTGIGTEVEETRTGYLSVAAPVRGADGAVLAALSATVPAVHADMAAVTRAVTRAAGGASEYLARQSDNGIEPRSLRPQRVAG